MIRFGFLLAAAGHAAKSEELPCNNSDTGRCLSCYHEQCEMDFLDMYAVSGGLSKRAIQTLWENQY